MLSAQASLLSTGVAACTSIILGLSVYNSLNKSIFQRFFLLFCTITTLWVFSNYLSQVSLDSLSSLWALRLHLFLTVWLLYFFLIFSVYITKRNLLFGNVYNKVLFIISLIVSFSTLTKCVFTGNILIKIPNTVIVPEVGSGIIFFVAYVLLMILFSMYLLYCARNACDSLNKKKITLIMSGMLISMLLISLSNMILPVFFLNTTFMPYAAFFILPFLLSILFAIYAYSLFDIKIMLIHLAFIFLWTTVFARLIISTSIDDLTEWSLFFFSVLVMGRLIIKYIIEVGRQAGQTLMVMNDLQKAINIISKINTYLIEEESLIIGN